MKKNLTVVIISLAKIIHGGIGGTGKYFSEALIVASTNPQYVKRLFIDLPDQVHENYELRTCCVHDFFIVCFCFGIPL